MAMKFHVSSLKGQEDAQNLKEVILTSEPDADVSVDAQNKVVTIDAKASEETFEELIVAAGHSIERT